MSDAIYSFRAGPSYRGATRQELFDAAMDQPMGIGATLLDQAKGGVLESLGLGTAIREGSLPVEAPTEPGVVVQLPDSEAIVVPDTPQMRRRQTVFGNPANVTQESPAQLEARRDAAGALDEDAYKSSPFYRQDIPWDAGMTEDRAAALAIMADAKKVREFYAEKRPIAAFLGNLAGQAVDPINYVPVAGLLVKAAAVARVGKIGGAALVGALDAAANTAIFGIGTASVRAKFGDDVSWQATVSQIATAALIGGAFGTIGGALGARSDAKVRAQVEDRLSTLRNTQEARVALNQAIDGLAHGEDIKLSANATDALARVASEVENLSRAYDQVLNTPTGPVDDPLVRLTPEEIEGTILARGAFKGVNELEFSDRGYGLVKIIWGHGEKASTDPAFQVSKDDITALPSVLREFEPAKVSSDGKRREWRIDRDGRTIVYADKVMNGDRHLVTTYVQEPNRAGADAKLSEKKKASQPVSQGVSTTPGNTAGGLSASLPGVAERPSQNIAQPRAVDNTIPTAEPAPSGRDQAGGSIARTEDTKALAAQYSVDPATGAFPEEAEVAQLAREGRLSDEDAAALSEADAAYETGSAYAEALKSVASCLI